MAEIDKLESAAAKNATDAWLDHVAEMQAKIPTYTSIFRDALKGVPDIIKAALTGGGGMGAAVEAVFSDLGANLGKKLGTQLAGALSGTLGKLGAKVGGAIFDMIPGIGAALGAALGPLLDKVTNALFKTEGKKVNDIRDAYVAAAGGIGALNAAAVAAGTSLDAMLKAGNVKDYDAAIKALDAKLKKSVADRQKMLAETMAGERLATQAFINEMQAAAKAGGDAAKEATDYFTATLKTASTGLTTMFAGLEKGATAVAQAAAVKMHIAAGMTEDAAKKAASSIVGIFVKSQVQATGLASAIAGTFGEMIARGASFREALAAIQGPLDTMRKQLQLTGLQGGAAFENLSRMSEIANGEITGPLTDAISGANAALQGLHNSGILNQEIFSGIAMSATDAYNQIIAQGADGQAALMMMQPTLQTIWKLQQDFGYEVDATTQALLDQAVASGLVGEAQMTDAQKQTAALEGIQDAVEQLVVLFGGTLPDAIGKTTQAAVSAASTIDGRMQTLISRDWSLDVQVNYDDPGFDPSANSSGMASGGVVYAAGGWQTKGSDIVPAMLTPGERVLTVAQNYDYENRMRSGSSAAQAPATVNITIQALDPVGLKKVVEREVVPLLVSAYRRNVNGARTDTRKELVE